MAPLYPLRSLPRRILRYPLRLIGGFVEALGGGHPLCARLYFFLFNSSFGREQQSFLAGRRAYHRTIGSPAGSMPLLRRNVHRLEKGLLMRPCRVPFALDYIGETVDAYVGAARVPKDGFDVEELGWARDVLSEYFRAHENEPAVERLRDAFVACDPEPESSPPARVPYRRDLGSAPSVTYDAISRLAMRRRSVRWFLRKPVDRRLIDLALEVGTQAPSACNRQPFVFRVFDDEELVRKIVSIPFGLAGYGHNVPVLAVVVGQQRHFVYERDRHLIYIDASLAVMGFILALETLGLSSCCVNWPDIEKNERKMASLLDLAPDERPVMLVAIGHPDPEGMVASSTKKPLARIRSYNFE